jgi:SNF2 family DNA or RNA helicase
LPEKEQRNWLFLKPHPKYAGRWYVDALHPSFFLDFEEVIGQYKTVSPAGLQEFLDYAKDLDYKVVFTDDPVNALTAYEHLNDPPPFSLNSDMPNTINGFLPFQLQGYNYLRNESIKGGIALWSTGTGKTALITGLTKYHLEVQDDWDLVFIVVKSNNKVDMQRKIRQLGDLESVIIDSYKADKRYEIYDIIEEALTEGEKVIAITNYEKFREDQGYFEGLVDGRSVIIFWDEMPTKLSNRETVLYNSVRTTLFNESKKVKWKNIRPKNLRQYDLSATPIENSPVGLLNQVILLDPDVFPVIKEWNRKYVQTYNNFNKEPETFKNLEELGLSLEFMVHQVDKTDPDIAAMFPEVVDIVQYVDWDPKSRRIYETMQGIAFDLAQQAKEDGSVEKLNAFQLIGILQMICDAPSMIEKSASNRIEFEEALAAATEDEYDDVASKVAGSQAAIMLLEALQKRSKKPISDEGHTKIEALKEIVLEKHPDEKIVVFSKLADYIQPVLSKFFDKWDVPYVIYRGTDKQRQEALDSFRNDPDIRIFFSSDAGSDSIDIPEASVAVDYDEPLKWSTKIQRRNRIHRVNSTFKFVTFYTLRMVNSIEDRIAEIIAKKEGFHLSVFKGKNAEGSISARMTTADLYYILTGDTLES